MSLHKTEVLSLHLINTRDPLKKINDASVKEGKPVANKNHGRCFMPIHFLYHIEHILALCLQKMQPFISSHDHT